MNEVALVEDKNKKEEKKRINLFDPDHVSFKSSHILPEKTVKLKPISSYLDSKKKSEKRNLNKKYPNRKKKHDVSKFNIIKF